MLCRCLNAEPSSPTLPCWNPESLDTKVKPLFLLIFCLVMDKGHLLKSSLKICLNFLGVYWWELGLQESTLKRFRAGVLFNSCRLWFCKPRTLNFLVFSSRWWGSSRREGWWEGDHGGTKQCAMACALQSHTMLAPVCTLSTSPLQDPWGHCRSYSILLLQVNWRKVVEHLGPVKKPVNGIQTKEPFLSTLHCLLSYRFVLFSKILLYLRSIWRGTTITLNTALRMVHCWHELGLLRKQRNPYPYLSKQS